jgi:hypothetical protein
LSGADAFVCLFVLLASLETEDDEAPSFQQEDESAEGLDMSGAILTLASLFFVSLIAGA